MKYYNDKNIISYNFYILSTASLDFYESIYVPFSKECQKFLKIELN